MNDFWRRLLELERRQLLTARGQDDLINQVKQMSNSVKSLSENFPYQAYTREMNYPWRIKTLTAKASFDNPTVRFQQTYIASMPGDPQGTMNYFNFYDGKIFQEMKRTKAMMINNSFTSTSTWGHVNTGSRATVIVYNADGTPSLDNNGKVITVTDLTCWPWPFDYNITIPGVNYSNTWYATYLNDPRPDWFAMFMPSVIWPPVQPARPVAASTTDWFETPETCGASGKWNYLYSYGGITPTYNIASDSVTWTHGNLFVPIDSGQTNWGDSSLIQASAFCGKLGSVQQGIPRAGTRVGATVTFDLHAIPAGSMWQGGPGTTTIPATFRFLEVNSNGLEIPLIVSTPATVTLTWT